MKKLLILALILLLPACAILNPPKFDNAEYSKIINIRMLTEDGAEQCKTADGQVLISGLLQKKISWLVVYSEFRPNNKHTQLMLRTFKLEADGFVARATNGNETYCRLKLENMHNQSIIIQRAFGIKRS